MTEQGGISFEEALESATAREVTVKLLLRQDLLARHAELDAALQQALQDDTSENRDPQGPRLARELAAFEAEIEAARTPFTFRAIGHRRWADLLAKHPPTKEQQRVFARLDHNPETFPPVAVAACCVSPLMTVDALNAAMDAGKINEGHFQELWQACVDANVGGGGAGPKSLIAGGIARASAALEKSLSESSGSREASSSDG